MESTPGYEIVDIAMDPSGNVTARIGAFPHGQGLKTTLAQIIADEVGVTPERITVIAGDTDQTPYGWGTFASRSLVISGGACLVGARKLKAKLIKIAAHLMKVAPEDVVLEPGFAKALNTNQSIPIPELARTAYHKAHLLYGVAEAGLSEQGFYDPPGTFSNACHVAVVEVDIETGGVKIERFMVVEDAGRLINPMIVDGQIHGGVAQGIANALLEEIIYDERGNILTATLADFLPPTMRGGAAVRAAPHRDLFGRDDHAGEGHRRRRRDRRAGRGRQCDQRCAVPVRRRVLRNAGDAATDQGGVACSESEETLMSSRHDITLDVNGAAYRVNVEARKTLVDAIREDCGLTGTHIGCEHGVCGACTVLVDGAAGALVPDVRGAGERASRSAPSKVSPRATRCIRCRRRSWSTTACSAGSARRAS